MRLSRKERGCFFSAMTLVGEMPVLSPGYIKGDEEEMDMRQTSRNTQARLEKGQTNRRCVSGNPFGRLSPTVLGLLLSLVMVIGMAGCGTPVAGDPKPSAEQPSVSAQTAAEASATPEASSPAEPAAESSEPAAQTEDAEALASGEKSLAPTMDRAGNPITIPESVERIVSLAPSFTEVLLDMGLADRIVGIELNAVGLVGVNPDWPVFDMMAPDTEKLLALAPDVLLASPMSTGGGEDPFKLIRDAGVCVIYVPSSSSIAEIEEDLRFLGAVVGAPEKAEALVNGMQDEIEAISAVGATVTEKKRVHFEISAAPYIYSFGKGVFLDEMITLIGAENVYADQESWIAVADEVAVTANPDVILTNVNYLPDPVGEIKARPGWDETKAVMNGDVYPIDNMSSSLPNHNIVKALREMAEAVYPDLY